MPRRLSEELTRKEMIDASTQLSQLGRHPRQDNVSQSLRAHSKMKVNVLRERISEAERQVEELFESLLNESLGG
jgi:hypothetical protein